MIKLIIIAALAFAAWQVFHDKVVTFKLADGADVSKRAMLTAFAVLACLVLVACGKPGETRVVSASVTMPAKPDADFQCMDEPDPTAVATDADDALYKLGLRRAWIDCRDRLGSAGRVWRATEAAMSKAIPPQGEK